MKQLEVIPEPGEGQGASGGSPRRARPRPGRGKSAGDVSERVRVRTGAAVLTPVERGDRLHVGGLELEVEQLEVLLHARWRHRLREHDVAALDVPPQDDLGRRLADLIGGLGDGRLVEHLALRDRRPRLGGDSVLSTIATQRVVGEVGVYLNLVHRRHRVGLGGQPLQVLDLEVRHADRAGAAVAVKLLERPPSGHEVTVIERGQRPVDEEQVHVVEVQLGKRGAERLAGIMGLMRPVIELAGDEDVAAVEAGCAYGLTDLLLVAVHLRGVYVPVADLEGLAHRPCGVLRLDLEDPETELRDGVTVVEGDAGDYTQSRLTPSSVVTAYRTRHTVIPRSACRKTVVHAPHVRRSSSCSRSSVGATRLRFRFSTSPPDGDVRDGKHATSGTFPPTEKDRLPTSFLPASAIAIRCDR